MDDVISMCAHSAIKATRHEEPGLDRPSRALVGMTKASISRRLSTIQSINLETW